ncbi:AraC family transcriptional regulator [Rhizobium sp. SSA_523]|uniref:helix-turn-helix domain-containing protein n=1 Tax=Rhizobium sp. SSA_523 TaxID=2952477 RepID=UPI002090EE25|nr:AraC family transcriptional regulator [Rhizobium sp. SSA_523]MCO5733888.1 AraC family transcriptional regulator [Rhizobium sp. SSA_523]WKC24847.1 AraC family transcriptional regulator [Rhizobium sp. SSA_523]
MGQQDELRLTFADPVRSTEIHAIRNFRGISLQYSRLHLPAEYEFAWEGQGHYLAYHDLILADGEMEVLGETPIAGGDLRDRMTYVPQGQTIKGWAKPVDRPNAFTVLCFDPGIVRTELESEFAAFEPHPQIYFQDFDLGATMSKLARLMANPLQAASSLYLETVSLTATLELLRINFGQSRRKGQPAQLSQAQCRQLLDYIEEHLAEEIGLSDLAALAGLSRFHFSRAFKASFHEAPYQLVLRKRVERAKLMLAQTRLSVHDVALACGFSNAAQLGRIFRNLVGRTPLAFRKTA